MTYEQVIRKWKLDYGVIAEKMGMPLGSFKRKISINQERYRFTETEEKKLCKVLKSLGADISKATIQKPSKK